MTGASALTIFSKISVDFPTTIIADAMHFRYTHKKRNFSYIDSLGYTLARKQNRLFLTGDSQFKEFPSVLFVQ